MHAAPVSLISRAYRGGGDGDGGGSGGGGATRLAGHVAAARNVAGPPHSPGAPHGRPSHGARRAAAARPALEALIGSIEAAQGRPRASSSALRGCGSARHRCRSAHGASPRGPRTGRPRLARQQLSGTSWRRERFCAWSWGTRARRWLGALVQLTGCATAALAGSRDARVVTLGGARWRASLETTAHPSLLRMDLPGGRPYPRGPRRQSWRFSGSPRSRRFPRRRLTKCLEKQRRVTPVFVWS